MKNLFAIDYKQENSPTASELFVTERLSPELEQKLNKANMQYADFSKLVSVPTRVTIVEYTALMLAVIFTLGILEPTTSFAEGYKNAAWIYWICPIFWIIFISIKIFERKKTSKVSKYLMEYIEEADKTICEIWNYFDIPQDSIEIDILYFKYTEKNGKYKFKNYSSFFSHLNCAVKIYIQNDNLYIVDLVSIMEIPLKSLKSVHNENKTVNFPYWNKKEAFNSEMYKPFKIGCNGGAYFAKYYSVQIEDERGTFEFFVPNYDINKLCELTGLSITD